ncbi:MAG: YeeE/YedE thiosulfate transporter family protein [Thermoanaerobaculia bacterium]|jgi:hypothetical protein
MSLPIEALVLSQRELGLVVAVVLGFGFGFVLERAGFGRATKLAAQFYLTDMTVLKVMFSAIVTAMGGLLVAAGLGLTDLSAISLSIAGWTWLWPMLVGGFVLGAGFIISGYCPGTCLVSAGSGNLDGLVAFAGVVVGSFVYNLLLAIPAVETFHTSGELGAMFLYELIGVPAPVVGVAVAIMAIGAFVGAEKIEAIMRRRRAAETEAVSADEPRPRRIAFATFLALAGLAVVLLVLPHGSGAQTAPVVKTIGAEELAKRLVDEPWRVRVIDLRPAAEYAASRVPGSERAEASGLAALELEYADPSREIVVITPSAPRDLPAALAAYRGEVRALDGGWPAWKAFALDAPQPPAEDATATERDRYAFRGAINASLTGQKTAPVASAPTTVRVQREKQKGGGCGA